jgi:type I restriction enzyme S subunit
MQEEKQLLPKLRFSEFIGFWEAKKLKTVAKLKRGAGSQYINYVGKNEKKSIRLIRIGDFLNSDSVWILNSDPISRFILKKDDILIAGTGATAGITFKVPDEFIGMAYSYNAPKISCQENVSSYFLIQYLKSPTITNQQRSLFTGNAQPFLDTKAINNFKIAVPSFQEQQKIANFFTAIDNRIQTLEKKKSGLEQYKKGVMQKIFKQELRFKDDTSTSLSASDGKAFPEWEEKKLGKLTYKVGKKNKENISYPIYSINNQEGFRPQSEQFEGLDSNDRGYDISLYKIVNKETFAYNPARINVGSIGYSFELNEVIISSLYVCFKTNKELEDMYLLAYLDTNKFNKNIFRYEEGGVRQYLFYENFSQIKIPLPSNAEQTKIANFLSAIDKNIELVTKKIEHTKTYKKGLLQQMFV